MKTFIKAAIAASLLLASATALPETPAGFPAAPAGFEWYVFTEGNTACLRPLDWHVKTEVKGDTAAMFISKEDIDKEGEFKTGFTLNVASNVLKRSGQSPSQFAQAYLDGILERLPDAKKIENPD